jgi:hypothetical protein
MTTEDPPRVKRRTLRTLKSIQGRLAKAEADATTLAAERGAALLEASDAGASRADLQAATGLSQARITQVLREARRRRAALDLIPT